VASTCDLHAPGQPDAIDAEVRKRKTFPLPVFPLPGVQIAVNCVAICNNWRAARGAIGDIRSRRLEPESNWSTGAASAGRVAAPTGRRITSYVSTGSRTW
jgi:hypothetical protein